MIFIHDTRNKPGKHDNVENYLRDNGHTIIRSKMYVGDIALLHDQSVCIDLKQNLQEVCSNICQQHVRFRNELIRAQEANIRLLFLVQHSRNIRTLSDVRHWKNPRLTVSPYALDGPALYQRLQSIEVKYNTVFYFCTKRETGSYIIQLLQNGGKPFEITINH